MKPWKRLRAWIAGSRLDRELADEMAAHRRLLEDQFLREGLSEDEARLAAARRFGNATASFERSRDEWRVLWIDSIAQDVRFALRLIRRQPFLTAAAVVTIALGVGANTAVTSVLQTALLNPLGLRDAGSVVVAQVQIAKMHLSGETSAVEFREIAAMRDTFSQVASMEGRWWTAEDNGEATRLVGRAVTPEFFAVFRERPVLGRFFTPDDRESLVLSYGLWQSRFGGDASVVGRAMMLDGKPYRIVGVAPRHFRVPANADAWAPLVLSGPRYERRGYNMMETVVARLKDGVSQAQAADRVNRYVAGLKAGPEGHDLNESGYTIDLQSFAHYVAGDLRTPLLLVWAAALLVLITGCANVAGLLLARSAGRKREIAIRFSLGASGIRVLRQLLVESLVLGGLGGAAGVVLAAGAIALARNITIPGGRLLALVTLDARLVAYALGVALVTALLFGLAPAVQLLRHNQTAAMTRSRRRFQNLFVMGEVAAASMLLVVTVLLLRSLWAVEQVRPGFDPTHLTTAFVIKPQNDDGFVDRLATALRSSPGVESAALAYPVPFTTGGLTSSFTIRNREPRPGEQEWHGEAYLISPGYLKTMGIRLLRGRDVAEQDLADAPTVCLVDDKLAQTFFPGEDPIGHEIAMYKGWARIVGVVATVRGTALEGLARPVVYYPLVQVPYFPSAVAVVRSSVASAPIIRQAVRRASARAPIFDMRTMEDRISESLGVRRVVVDLLAVFAGITVLLSAIGLHSVIAQIVGERTPEIGIRIALGARPAQVLSQFLLQGLRAGVVGLVAGLGAAAYAQKWLASLLYEIKPFDAATFGVTSVGLLLLLTFAVWWPARRASRIDPQVALRYE
jgi:putative ABC transport system permease protein